MKINTPISSESWKKVRWYIYVYVKNTSPKNNFHESQTHIKNKQNSSFVHRRCCFLRGQVLPESWELEGSAQDLSCSHQFVSLDVEVPQDLELFILNHLWRWLPSLPWDLLSILGADVSIHCSSGGADGNEVITTVLVKRPRCSSMQLPWPGLACSCEAMTRASLLSFSPTFSSC